MDHGIGHTDNDVTRQLEEGKGKGEEKALLWGVSITDNSLTGDRRVEPCNI